MHAGAAREWERSILSWARAGTCVGLFGFHTQTLGGRREQDLARSSSRATSGDAAEGEPGRTRRETEQVQYPPPGTGGGTASPLHDNLVAAAAPPARTHAAQGRPPAAPAPLPSQK